MHFFHSLLSAAVLILSTNAASCGIQPKVASGWQGSGTYQIINVAGKTGIDLFRGGSEIVGHRAYAHCFTSLCNNGTKQLVRNLESQNQVWKISLVSVDGACGSFAIQNNRTLDAITSNGGTSHIQNPKKIHRSKLALRSCWHESWLSQYIVPQRVSPTKFTANKTQLWNIKVQDSGAVVYVLLFSSLCYRTYLWCCTTIGQT